MSKRVNTKNCLTKDCTVCKGFGSYVTDDFNHAEGEVLYVQVCTRCNNEAGLPLVTLTGAETAIVAAFPGAQIVPEVPVPARRASVPTPRQIKYIGDLIADLEELGDTEIHGLVAARISGYDFGMASKCIDRLKLRKAQRIADRAAAQPQQDRASAQVAFQDIPAGHYAVKSLTGNNDLDFVAVSVGKDGGRWAGFRFVTRIAGDNEFPVRGAQAREILAAIAKAGVNESGALYGQEIGCCFKCHTHLTRQYSRGLGYGPTCADKLGLPFDHAEYARSPKISDEEGE